MLRLAYQNAGISPNQVQYIEALLDEAGQRVTAAYGLQFQRLKRAAGADLESWLYEFRWEHQVASKVVVTSPDRAGGWPIFADRAGLGQTLADRLAYLGESATLIFPGLESRCLAAGQYQLNPVQPEGFRQLLQDAIAETQARGIIHLWSLEAEAIEINLGAENGSASLDDLSRDEVEALLAEELAVIDDLLN